ncbi:MAG: hypothetical protein V1811_02205 [Candidatus Micrarchaeota archaeon]
MTQLLDGIRQVREALEKKDSLALKELSSGLAGDSFLLQDPSLLELSLVSYALNKFLTKPYIFKTKEWALFSKKTVKLLDASEKALDSGQESKAREAVHSILSEIQKLSDSLGRFVSSVLDKARLKAGAEIYAKGASLGQASFLSGADKRELSFYIGSTRLSDQFESMPLKQRIDQTMELFG